MNEKDILIKGKIPCNESGIQIKRTICDICSPGMHCGIDAYVKDGKVIKIEGTKKHPQNKGLLCTKGLCNREYIYRKDRIKTPLKRIGKRGEGKFKIISWDEAYAEIAEKLNEVKHTHGAESVAFFSGYSKWYRPFLHRFAYSFGSPNYGTESSACSTSAKMAWLVSTGKSASPNMNNSKAFLGWAFNPYYSRYLAAGPIAQMKKKGMKIIIVDPRITPAVTKLADMHLRIKPGTDGALALGMGKLFIENNWIDKEYIKNHVYGFNEYAEYVKEFTLDKVSKITGIEPEDIYKATKLLAENTPFSINESDAPVSHHINGFQNYRAIIALLAITGNYDRKGGNIPKDSTFNYKSTGFTVLEKKFIEETMPKNTKPKIGAHRFPLWNELVDEFQAMDLTRQIYEKEPYEIKALFSHGLNFRMFPDSLKLINAIKELDFFVNIDLFLTDTSKYADIVLPACSSFERGEFKVYQGGYAEYTNPVIKPLYESKSDVDILTDLAHVMDLKDELLKSGYENCIKYMISNLSIRVEELKANDLPVYVPEYKEYVEKEFTKKGYFTPTGKFELKSTIIEKLKNKELDPLPTYREPLEDEDKVLYPFTLTTGARIPNALHSRLHEVKWLRSMRKEPSADINVDDAKKLSISNGDDITIYTQIGSINVKANLTAKVLPGNIHMYHGYKEADVNSIINGAHLDPYSGFPGYRSVRCNIKKYDRGIKKDEICF